jgi:hypothetical protein
MRRRIIPASISEPYKIDDNLEIFVLFALTLDPSPGGRGKCIPFSLREKGWDEGMFVSNFVRLNNLLTLWKSC